MILIAVSLCNISYAKIALTFFQLDLRDIGEKWLPTDLNTGRVKVDYVSSLSIIPG